MLRSLFNYFIPKGLKLANNLEALRAMTGVKHRLLELVVMPKSNH
jgi:hypothetical protein